ncbi:MAG: hypothetical protein E6G96_03335 [Alphaproteobacteria bacterium]|nr:MAG: hypothetical protein E6G96_03335 [Alphaproteobacteria bacterium]
MDLCHTWFACFGLLFGLLAADLFSVSLLRSAAIGFVAGAVLVTLVNVVQPTPAPCLQNAKGWDILRAYSLNCAK